MSTKHHPIEKLRRLDGSTCDRGTRLTDANGFERATFIAYVPEASESHRTLVLHDGAGAVTSMTRDGRLTPGGPICVYLPPLR